MSAHGRRDLVSRTFPLLVVDQTSHTAVTGGVTSNFRNPKQVAARGVQLGTVTLLTIRKELPEGLRYIFSALMEGKDPRMQGVKASTWNEEEGFICI